MTRRTAPRELAREIVDRCMMTHAADGTSSTNGEPGRDGFPSFNAGTKIDLWGRNQNPSSAVGREKIEAIYLSPDAFARRTDEASIAEQMGDVFVAAGLPRPVQADDDRVGGWMLMYQMLDAAEWLLTGNCTALIQTLPALLRDSVRVEDVQKVEGDDAADAARYGLKSRYGLLKGKPGRIPLEQRLAARVLSSDPTIRAIQARQAQIEETKKGQPIPFFRSEIVRAGRGHFRSKGWLSVDGAKPKTESVASMPKWFEILRGLMVSPYRRALEAEVLRLRAENRALLNSILGIAGLPA